MNARDLSGVDFLFDVSITKLLRKMFSLLTFLFACAKLISV